jgi:hypothetical protein
MLCNHHLNRRKKEKEKENSNGKKANTRYAQNANVSRGFLTARADNRDKGNETKRTRVVFSLDARR